MHYFTTYPINDHIYQIKDAMGVLSTLVIGSNYALLVDTGYGIKNIKEYIYTLTDKPLIVIASHGHMDHTGGNYLFDSVYIHPLDIPLCRLHNSRAWREKNILSATSLHLIDDSFDEESYLNQREGNLLPLEENQIFFLGNLHAKIIPMEGHTAGSIGVLLEEDQILIVTDATCPFVWLFLEESLPVSTYVHMLERTLTLSFDHILLGHGAGKLLPRQKVFDFLNIAKTIDLKKSVKVSFSNFNQNSYCYTLGKLYDQNDCGVVFDPKKM